MVKAVFPGTFDPVTLGHLDLLRRGLALFDEVVVAVADNPSKKAWFSRAERVELFRLAAQGLERVRVETFSGLLVDYVINTGARVIVRGMRFVSDFEYEVQMALVNRRLKPEIETVLLAPSEEQAFIDATIVRAIVLAGGSVETLVPACICGPLYQRAKEISQGVVKL